MSLQTKTIGRMPTDHGPYDPELAYGKKFQCTLFGCVWESLNDNNNTAPAVWDGSDTITPNLVDWKKVSGSYESWLMTQDKPAKSEEHPFNGMGRVRLKKNLVEVEEGGETVTKNLLTQAMFEDGDGNPLTNTVYVIQYDYALGEDISVPANCVLKFDGGSISASGNNGTITGNDTQIQNISNGVILNNVVLKHSGSLTDDTYKGWKGYCSDLWFAYTPSSKAHYDIVYSVCQFEYCEFHRAYYYLERFESIPLRNNGCFIDGNGTTFYITSNKGETQEYYDGVLQYKNTSLFTKNGTINPINSTNFNYGCGNYIVKNITILDNKDIIADAGFGEDVTAGIQYDIFTGSGIVTMFENVTYNGAGELYHTWNPYIAIEKLIFKSCDIKSNFFCLEYGGLGLIESNTLGSCNSVILEDCKFYMFKDTPFTGGCLSFVNSGVSEEDRIPSNIGTITMTNCICESECAGSNEMVADKVIVSGCTMCSVGINNMLSGNSATKYSKEYIVTNNVFKLSDNYKKDSSYNNLNLSGDNILFANNTYVYSEHTLPLGIRGYGDEESSCRILDNSFVFDYAISDCILFENVFVTLLKNKYVVNCGISSINLQGIKKFDKLDIWKDPYVKLHGTNIDYISDANRDANGYLINDSNYPINTTFSNAKDLTVTLYAKLDGTDSNSEKNILGFVGNNIPVIIQTYYQTFRVNVGSTPKSSGVSAFLGLPKYGADANGDIAKIDVCFTNHYNENNTACILYINDTQVDFFYLDSDILGDVSGFEFKGSSYCRIKYYQIGEYGYITKSPEAYPAKTRLNNNGNNNGFPVSGTVRPTNAPVGYQFFDKSSNINKPIWYKGKQSDEDVWVDATGTPV